MKLLSPKLFFIETVFSFLWKSTQSGTSTHPHWIYKNNQYNVMNFYVRDVWMYQTLYWNYNSTFTMINHWVIFSASLCVLSRVDAYYFISVISTEITVSFRVPTRASLFLRDVPLLACPSYLEFPECTVMLRCNFCQLVLDFITRTLGPVFTLWFPYRRILYLTSCMWQGMWPLQWLQKWQKLVVTWLYEGRNYISNCHYNCTKYTKMWEIVLISRLCLL